MDEIIKQEKEKYIKTWQLGLEGQSRTAWYIFQYLKDKWNKNYNILDLGCGNGVITELLRQEGFVNSFGVDITLEGLKGYKSLIKFNQPIPKFIPNLHYYVESPLWNLPFKDKAFDYTFSCDVLEHIPTEMVDKTIQEIIRVTKIETFHCIATFPDRRGGVNFHLTIQPINWWKETFNNYNKDNLSIGVIDRTEFLKIMIPNYTGK